MSEAVKDIALDADEGIEAKIGQATKALRDQLAAKDAETAQLRRIAADRDAAARKAQGDLTQTDAYVKQVERSAIANAMAEAEARLAILERDLALAIETADGKTAAKIQREIAELGPKKVMLEQGKSRIEEDIEEAKRRAEYAERNPPKPQEQPLADSFEQAIRHLNDEEKKWLRQHKDKGYIRPDRAQIASDRLLDAYKIVENAGLRQGTPQFMAAMDKVLGHTQQQAQAEQGNAADRFVEVRPEAQKQQPARQQQPPQQRQAMPAAPVSRSAGGGSPRGGAAYKLTAAEAQTAERMGMSHAEYLDGLQKGIARGKYPTNYLNR